MKESDAPSKGLFSLLDNAFRRQPEAPFLIEADRSYTFEEIHLSARSLANWWRSRGVGRGDRVVICCQNRVEIATGIFAASLIGAIFVVLNPRLRPHGVRKILRQVEMKALIVDGETLPLFEGCEIPDAAIFAGAGDTPTCWTGISEALEWAPADADSWPGIDVDPVCLVFTSGSTAEPRGVTLSHDNIAFVTAAIQDRLRYRSDDVVGCFLPLAFDYGLYQIFLTALSGAALYVGDPGQVGPRLPRILAEAEVSVLPGVPTIYAGLIALHRRRPLELPRLRAVTNTGERLPLAYIEQLEAMFPGVDVFPMYGLTECKRVSILLPEERSDRPESVGQALAGTEVYAVNKHGETLPPGEIGELVVCGRHIAHGYWRAPEETAMRFRKRAPERPVELYTGDRGSVDAQGFITFAARADDLIKHRGNRISPVEIETEACAVSGVAEASLMQRKSDDTLHLFVTLSQSLLTAQAILEELAQKLEPQKVPDFIVISPELPKSINGKIDRKSLRNRLENPDLVSHETIPETAGV